jgi:hypothetical protein
MCISSYLSPFRDSVCKYEVSHSFQNPTAGRVMAPPGATKPKLFKLKLECLPQAQDREYAAAEKSNKQALSARFTSEM